MDDYSGKNGDWLRATEQQVRELEHLRRLVSHGLRRLRRRMRESKGAREQEDCMADILRLSQVQMKLIPMERDLRREMEEARQHALSPARALEEEDWRVMEDALERRRFSPGSGGPASGNGSQGAGTERLGVYQRQHVEGDTPIGEAKGTMGARIVPIKEMPEGLAGGPDPDGI